MLGCLDPGVIAAVSVVECGASEAAHEVRLMEGAVVMDAADMLLVAVTSRNKTCTETTQVRAASRQVDTVKDMVGIIEDTVIVMAREVSSQSPVNKLWFAM